MTYLAEMETDTALAPLQSAACTYRIALSPRTGQKVLTLRTTPGTQPGWASGVDAENTLSELSEWYDPYRSVATGIHAPSGCFSTPAKAQPHSFPWRARAKCEASL